MELMSRIKSKKKKDRNCLSGHPNEQKFLLRHRQLLGTPDFISIGPKGRTFHEAIHETTGESLSSRVRSRRNAP